MANTKILVTGATGGYRSNYREDTFGNEGAGKSARARRRCSSIATERVSWKPPHISPKPPSKQGLKPS